MDTLTREQRSACMSKIRSKDTKPELAVRRVLVKTGFRYRLYARELPGKPDIANRRKKIAIFINGCFWHQHPGCKRKSRPKSNSEYWEGKLNKNIKKQESDIKMLEELGWKVKVLWECQTKDTDFLEKEIRCFLYD